MTSENDEDNSRTAMMDDQSSDCNENSRIAMIGDQSPNTKDNKQTAMMGDQSSYSIDKNRTAMMCDNFSNAKDNRQTEKMNGQSSDGYVACITDSDILTRKPEPFKIVWSFAIYHFMIHLAAIYSLTIIHTVKVYTIFWSKYISYYRSNQITMHV